MHPRAARGSKLGGNVRGILGIDRFLIGSTLEQAHTATALDVYGGINRHSQKRFAPGRRGARLKPMSPYQVPPFLVELLRARSPSGYEGEAQAVFDRHVKPAADEYANDALGNRIATLNPRGDPVLMLAGHMDELGLIITFVNKDGFLYFDTIGGHDLSVISGRRVILQTAHGLVKGVTGKRAIHLMDEEDRKKVPKKHEIWIDIGASSKADALERVSIGDVATYDHEFELVHGII